MRATPEQPCAQSSQVSERQNLRSQAARILSGKRKDLFYGSGTELTLPPRPVLRAEGAAPPHREPDTAGGSPRPLRAASRRKPRHDADAGSVPWSAYPAASP